MDVSKLLWAVRGLAYKILLGRFGNMSYLGKPLSMRGKQNIHIGDRVRIYPGARMEAIGSGCIVIERNTAIAQNVHVTCDKEELVIGSNTTVSGNVFITNIDHNYKEVGKHIMKQKRIVKTTRIGENCFIGYGAAIQAGTILGKQCIVGTNAVVRGTFPDYCVIVGVPARAVKKYNPKTKEWERILGSNDKCCNTNV